MKAQSQAFVATGKDIVDLAEGFQHLEYIISSDADAGHAETPKWGKSPYWKNGPSIRGPLYLLWNIKYPKTRLIGQNYLRLSVCRSYPKHKKSPLNGLFFTDF